MPVPKFKKKNKKKLDAKVEQVLSETAKKPSKQKEKVGLYPVGDKLVVITWDKETDKKIMANSGQHKEAPLFKDRVLNSNAKVLKRYNEITDEIGKLHDEKMSLMSIAGLYFTK